MVFLEHHRHLSEIKLKIQGLTQRTIGILALATGWVVLAKQAPDEKVKLALIFTVLLISISALVALKRFNENYRVESKIIKKLNHYFKLFKSGEYLENDSIYPSSWGAFGEHSFLIGLGHHIIAIIVMALLSISAIWLRV